MSKNNSQSRQSDEIDLLDLFRKMFRALGRGFITIGRCVLFIVVFLIKKWIPLGLSVIAGIGISFLIMAITEDYYISDLTIRTNAVANSDMIDYVNKIHTFCIEGNLSALARSFSLDNELAGNIKDLQAYWIIDLGNDGIPDYIDLMNKHDAEDTINVRMPNRFVVRVKTTTPKELRTIREGLLSYINTNDFFRQQNDIRIVQVREMLDRMNYEIEQLDSLQKVKYFEETRNMIPKMGGQMVFLQELKTQLLHSEITSLYGLKQYYERELNIYPDIVTLLSDYTPSSRPENGFSYYCNRLIPIVLGFAVIIIVIYDNRKRLKEIYEKYQVWNRRQD